MKTRVGKIGRLGKAVREELNRRLEDGQQGPEVLAWLNGLPTVRTMLAKDFNGEPINKFNLSAWRHGGFEEWRRLQAREERIERIAKQGLQLKKRESEDLFEDFARIVVAELAVDLDSLDDIKDRDERWQRLRELSREFVWLQNGFNKSRKVDLEWTKYNDLLPGDEGEAGSRMSEGGEEESSKFHPPSSDCGATRVPSSREHPTSNEGTENGKSGLVRPLPEAASRHGGDSHDCGGVEAGGGGLKRKYDVKMALFRRCGCLCEECNADRELTAEEVARAGKSFLDRRVEHIYRGGCECFCEKCEGKEEIPNSKFQAPSSREHPKSNEGVRGE